MNRPSRVVAGGQSTLAVLPGSEEAAAADCMVAHASQQTRGGSLGSKGFMPAVSRALLSSSAVLIKSSKRHGHGLAVASEAPLLEASLEASAKARSAAHAGTEAAVDCVNHDADLESCKTFPVNSSLLLQGLAAGLDVRFGCRVKKVTYNKKTCVTVVTSSGDPASQ
jgi:hypothetical protein